ncbi:5'/3'-nucleotidase SurE [candidate division KSB3 bacterium]|uniref:5'-nucleotidase SurE n=1 Tax=candidate division KSB3 bacterium TaxID=2044937 RepID=A0A2G6KD94_9BACT|nr:MAG: 5'/3'-nucleotidase SurE [candidate division KSB3 bacterium]
MHILLTNDDGVYADGIAAMYRALQETDHHIDVVAPLTEQSAVGHAITMADPLKVSTVDVEFCITGHAVRGTPADCVKLAINTLLDTKPDLVISGINRGANTGNHIIYSGTVSAATEATMYGIPSIAISLAITSRTEAQHDFRNAARFAVQLAEKVFQQGGLPAGTLLNVNVPEIDAEQIKGVRIGQQAKFHHTDEFEKRKDPANQTYFWLKFEDVIVLDPPEVDVDYRLVKDGYIVVTPIHYDLTDYEMLTRLKTWTFGG